MQKWMIPANPKKYDHERFFNDHGYVDWMQRLKFQVGDIVYLYCSAPLKKVMYKTKVIKESMQFSECTYDRDYWTNPEDYENASNFLRARLELIEFADKEELSLEFLKENGLNAAPQKGIKVPDNLAEYMDKYFKQENSMIDSEDMIVGDEEHIFTGKVWSMNIARYPEYEEAWNLFKKNSCISIDYFLDVLDSDYSSYETVDEIRDFLNDEASQQPDLIHRFVNKVEKGDIFIAHKGRNILAGVGVVLSEYIYQNDDLNHVRKVDWFYVPDNMELKDGSFFKTYNIVRLDEEYPYFVNEILARIAGKDKSVRNKLLDFIFERYYHDFYSINIGQDHFSRYELGKEKIQNDWKIINEKISNHQDWSDDFWKNLFHRDLELFSIGGNDLRGMIQARSKKKYDFSDEDMDNLAIEFVNTVNNLLNTSDESDQKQILDIYCNDIYKSYGFQTGVMSPILFYLDESSFYPINSKAIKTVRLLSLMLDDETGLSSELIKYVDSNKKYKSFLKKLSNEFYFENLNVGDIRVFDEFCHWICDSKLGNYADSDKKVVEIFPIRKILGSGDYKKPFKSDEKRNIIYFGAPGTGKSYNLNQDKEDLLGFCPDNYERVTFHPDYSYANFVGTYKPVPKDKEITYKYVPGPFMRILKKALNNPSQPYLLVIEEINRANVAAVFGDVFQLLDRNENNESEYDIETSQDMRRYINEDKIKLPPNLFIWATMNSADQGVFPMDTAFKRRWDFKHFSIDSGEDLIKNTKTMVNGVEIYWNTLRKAINHELLSYKINEDKLMGPFFAFNEFMNEIIDEEVFKDIFKNKIIMYLFEDAARSRRNELFSGVGKTNVTYSQICESFDENGIEIFTDSVKDNFIKDGGD